MARAQAAKAAAEAEIAADSRNEQETTASAMARAALERAELRLSAAHLMTLVPCSVGQR